MKEQGRILVIDDEPGVRSALDGILRDEGFEVWVAESGEQGLEVLQGAAFDAILLDVWLPGIDGLETLTQIRETKTDAEVVMISGHGTIETAVRATKLGAFDFVEKPLSLDRTLLVLRNALRQRRLSRANARLMSQLQRDTEILGDSTTSDTLRRQVAAAAVGDSAVLIAGPQGSGRENLARRIHGQGVRAEGPFVEVPFGAMDADRAEQALFGTADRPGRMAMGLNGTLFLEDVDRLPANRQQRLAAYLVDASRSSTAPRWIASVRSIDDIGDDLRQALDVIRIEIPPLAHRKEDLQVLAERFLRDFSKEYGKEPIRLPAETIAALRSYHWPGDVRELRNTIERWSVTRAGQLIGADLVPGNAEGTPDGTAVDLYGAFDSLADGTNAFRSFHIRRALRQANGDASKASSALKISTREVLAVQD